MPAHLLLIEDDPDILTLLCSELEEAGYRVSSAGTVMDALQQAHETRPDLIVTDLGLPDGNGRDIVTRLRRDRRIPILVLTARDDLLEKVELLGLGASDYLVKPYQLGELLARIAVQLRAPVGNLLESGPLTVCPSHYLASLNGEDLQLTARELALLTVLMQHPGRVYSPAELIRIVWSDQLASDSNVVAVHISRLREKFRRHGQAGLVRSVRGFGYAIRVDR
ncbi:response regulator transcription factor [Deinococcus altitudinis]|uniref:response regulator transcription factor n=1 Tax=Deinococcus altitudinis TaxID=468914 RepID=UPI003892C40D